MAKLMPIKTFVAELEKALNRKDGYIMGATGQDPKKWATNSWWFTQYSGSQKTKALYWREHAARVWDCNGLAEGLYKDFSGVDINTKARYNYANWCSVKGSGVIPANKRVAGAAIFWSNSGASSIHHVAYLWKPVVADKPGGDWYIIEARGVMYGVVSGKLLSRKPTHWGYMDKYFDYTSTVKIEDVVDVVTTTTLGSRILKNGMEGEDVKEMQTGLIRLGYNCGKYGADGDFGDCTELAVKAFQKDHPPLDVDGEFGPLSLAAYEAALVVLEKPVEAPQKVVIEGGDCYVRSAPDKATGKILGVAKRGTELQYGGQTVENGWHLVAFNNANGWVSGLYGRLVK